MSGRPATMPRVPGTTAFRSNIASLNQGVVVFNDQGVICRIPNLTVQPNGTTGYNKFTLYVLL
jgi:hypothetical protein